MHFPHGREYSWNYHSEFYQLAKYFFPVGKKFFSSWQKIFFQLEKFRIEVGVSPALCVEITAQFPKNFDFDINFSEFIRYYK